jgi:hypothetical protein
VKANGAAPQCNKRQDLAMLIAEAIERALNGPKIGDSVGQAGAYVRRIEPGRARPAQPKNIVAPGSRGAHRREIYCFWLTRGLPLIRIRLTISFV